MIPRTGAWRPESIVSSSRTTIPIFRKGLRTLLEAEHGFTVVGEAGGGEEAIRLAQQLKPDILLLDLAMPGVSGMTPWPSSRPPPRPSGSSC
jgi:CheY-like chemotaxis protein